MKVVLYFGKINLISDHLQKVYKGEMQINDILSSLLMYIKDGTEYIKEHKFKLDDEIVVEEIKYSIAIKKKSDTVINGYLYKTSKLHFKNFNKVTKELERKAIDNDEGVEFYFDVLAEMVGYHTSNRLGYKEFLEAFQEIINISCKNAGTDYRFNVKQYTKGLSIDEINKELKSIENIQKLTIKYQLPNAGEEILNKIQKNAESTIERFDKANMATKSVVLTAASSLGINVDSDEVKEEMEQIQNLHSSVSMENATRHGYVEVATVDGSGIEKTTADKKPVKKKISNIIEFEEACKDVIRKRGVDNLDRDD